MVFGPFTFLGTVVSRAGVGDDARYLRHSLAMKILTADAMSSRYSDIPKDVPIRK